jgi:hypothetical protein
VVVVGRLLLRFNEVVPEAVDPNHGLLGVEGARGKEAIEAWSCRGWGIERRPLRAWET